MAKIKSAVPSLSVRARKRGSRFRYEMLRDGRPFHYSDAIFPSAEAAKLAGEEALPARVLNVDAQTAGGAPPLQQ